MLLLAHVYIQEHLRVDLCAKNLDAIWIGQRVVPFPVGHIVGNGDKAPFPFIILTLTQPMIVLSVIDLI